MTDIEKIKQALRSEARNNEQISQHQIPVIALIYSSIAGALDRVAERIEALEEDE